MQISIIVAMAKNHVIGLQNKMPWELPEDLKYFKSITMGKPIVMGRNTFESIGQALPGRRNVILTKNQNFKALNCDIAASFDDALKIIGDVPEVMIIGGGVIYKELLPMATKLYITQIETEVQGDTFFPEFNKDNWKLTSKSEMHISKKGLPYSFLVYQK